MNTPAIAAAPAIIALVQMAKDAGLRTAWAAPLAVALGVVLATADHLLSSSGTWQAASNGLLLGLGAAGLYDTARMVGQKRPA